MIIFYTEERFLNQQSKLYLIDFVDKKEGQNFNIYLMECKYRNCKNEVIGRPNKKFCKIQCKRNELKYKQRKRKNGKN